MKSSACSIAMLVSALVVAVSGCSTQPQQPGQLTDSPSVSSNATQSSAQSADEQAVIDAYKGYFETVQALGAADEGAIRTKLAPYAQGPAVENIVAGMAKFRALNQQPAGHVVFAELDVSVSGDSATVQECHNGSTELIIDSATGAVISTGPIRGLKAEIVRTSGGWRVASYDRADGIC